jgi:hypothetical protein
MHPTTHPTEFQSWPRALRTRCIRFCSRFQVSSSSTVEGILSPFFSDGDSGLAGHGCDVDVSLLGRHRRCRRWRSEPPAVTCVQRVGSPAELVMTGSGGRNPGRTPQPPVLQDPVSPEVRKSQRVVARRDPSKLETSKLRACGQERPFVVCSAHRTSNHHPACWSQGRRRPASSRSTRKVRKSCQLCRPDWKSGRRPVEDRPSKKPALPR